MALGMEVGFGPGDFVFDGDPATPRTEGITHYHPVFGPCLLWPNGWMDEDAIRYRSRRRPRPHYIRQDPSSARNGHNSPHHFGPCLLWARSPISATAELLFNFSKMATVRHLSFVMRMSRPSAKGIWWSLSLCKIWFESNQYSFDKMQILILCKLGLKTPIHGFGVWGQNREGWCDVDSQRTRSYFWGLLPLCHFWSKLIKKCDRENADRQTDTRTDRDKLNL